MQYLSVSVIAGSYQALPIEIYSSEGVLICRGAVSSKNAVLFNLSLSGKDKGQGFERVYVFTKLPGGRTIQTLADLNASGGIVELNLAKSSPYEWLDWVTPFRSLNHLSYNGPHGPEGLSVLPPRRIGKVWATLWGFKDNRWDSEEVYFERLKGERGVLQLTLEVPCNPHLLQLGGEELSWRMISLPPGNRVNVALTPRLNATDGDALDITVGREAPDNEIIMSYLSQGYLPEVSSLAELMVTSDRMLFEKFNNPISAVAGAYVLLKTGKLKEREAWLDNLNLHFPYIADIWILKATLAREKEGDHEKDIRQMLLDAMDMGFPVFSLGMILLHEGMAVMHSGESETRSFHRAFLAAQAYVRARFTKSAYFAFYGKSPAEPLWIPVYGTERAGAATPASLGSTPPVFMGRPKGSPRSVKYGTTSVTLPFAPAGAHLQHIISEYAVKNSNPEDPDHVFRTLSLPKPLREQARISENSTLPSLILKTLPDYLNVKNLQGTSENIIVDSITQSKLPPATERRPRLKGNRRVKDWKSARITHSIMVMDEDE